MIYAFTHWHTLAARLIEHVVLVGISLVLALALAVPLGVLVARSPRAGGVTLAVLSAIYTIPSLALLAVLVSIFGLGAPTAVVALVAYAQMLLVRNVAEGLRGVPAASLDAARGLGFTSLGSLVRIELPLAFPAIVGGVRIATVSLISLATVAAWIDAGGLGTLVFEGLHQDDPAKIIAGSGAAALLAIVADIVLRIVERAAVRA